MSEGEIFGFDMTKSKEWDQFVYEITHNYLVELFVDMEDDVWKYLNLASLSLAAKGALSAAVCQYYYKIQNSHVEETKDKFNQEEDDDATSKFSLPMFYNYFPPLAAFASLNDTCPVSGTWITDLNIRYNRLLYDYALKLKVQG